MQHTNVYHGSHGILCVFLTTSEAREQIQSFVNGRQTPSYIPANHRILKLKGTQDSLSPEHLHLQTRSLQSLEKDHSRSPFQKGEGDQNLGVCASWAIPLLLSPSQSLTLLSLLSCAAKIVCFIFLFLETNELPFLPENPSSTYSPWVGLFLWVVFVDF